jgi:hypothetical protein
VRSEVTPQEAVAQALARFGDLSRLAFVLNDRVGMPTDFYYDYDGYYTGGGGADAPSGNPIG